jgi:ABC-2 type transport system permease protein
LAAGTVAGIAVLIGGVLLGGRVFDRRGPEMLAAAMRA